MNRWPTITLSDLMFIFCKVRILLTTGFADVPIIPGRPPR